jgi:hypothetical protein
MDLTRYPTVEVVLARESSDPSLRPPKKWWDEMHKRVKKNNPSYSDEQNLSKGKRAEIRKREGKHYGPAK